MEDINCMNGVLAFLTLILAIFTGCLWWESKRTRQQNVTPQISVYFYPLSTMDIALRIENTSRTDARDVNIECLTKNTYDDGKGRKFDYSEELSKEFSYLACGQQYSFIIGKYNFMKDEIFEFDVSFKNLLSNSIINRKISIDISRLEGIMFESPAGERIAKSLENLDAQVKSTIGNAVPGHGLRVYSYSGTELRIKKLEEDVAFYRNWRDEINQRSKE